MRYCVLAAMVPYLLIISTTAAQSQEHSSRGPAAELRQAWKEYFEQVRDNQGLEFAPMQGLAEEESLEAVLESKSTFLSPPEILSVDGELTANLEVKYGINQIGEDPVRLRSYNGQLVGPTLRAKAGDVLKIKLINSLPEQPVHNGDHNQHHEWNTTNLHTHGLHVSPSANADNVFVLVEPGGEFDYEIAIPSNHVAGTFWYHAHKHGAVSAQVASGMSGVIIIEGGIDAIPEISAASERIFVFQQIPYINSGRPFGEVELKDLTRLFAPGAWDMLGRNTTVNGTKMPVLIMRPGEVQRWRLLHSGFRESLLLRLERGPQTSTGPDKLTFHELAVDGIPLSRVADHDVVEMWPGYRSDVLVKAPNVPGAEYLLVDERTNARNSVSGLSESRKYIARVIVRGTPVNMDLPATDSIAAFRPPSITDSEVTGTQSATYGINVAGSVNFEIDGREYNPAVVRKLTVGDVEEWTVKSINNVGVVHHPFHIHVNPFEVISLKDENGVEQLAEPVWRDTIILRADWTVKFRSRYEDFTGKFVQHCHILDHEDQGMMEVVEIVHPATGGLESSQTGSDDDILGSLAGRVHVLNFFIGTDCLHCNRQLAALAERLSDFEKVKLKIVCISAMEDTSNESFPIPIVSDPKHHLFDKFGCFYNGPTHGTVIVNDHGKVIWRVSGDAPFMDFDTVLEVGKAAIDLNNAAESVSGIANVAASAVNPMLRRNIDDLSTEELETLKHAFSILKARPASDPTSLAYQIGLHNGANGPCEHGSELFLPWHRAHLYFFEKLLREADPPRTSNIRLPYWDWTKQASGSRYPMAFEDQNSVLYHAIRRKSASSLPTPDEINEILDINSWEDFGGSSPNGYGELELKPHNHMHSSFIAGSMGNPTSAAEDPIYWAFHCYIDLLWDRWQKYHEIDPVCLDCKLRGMPDNTMIANVLHVEDQLGYTYGANNIPLVAIGNQESGLESSSGANSTSYQFSIPGSYSGRARIIFSAIEVPKEHSYRAELYLHPKSERFRLTDDFRQKYYFDYFVMWKSSADVPHHPELGRVSLRGLHRRLTELTAEHAGEEWLVTVNLAISEEESGLESELSLSADLGPAFIELGE